MSRDLKAFVLLDSQCGMFLIRLWMGHKFPYQRLTSLQALILKCVQDTGEFCTLDANTSPLFIAVGVEPRQAEAAVHCRLLAMLCGICYGYFFSCALTFKPLMKRNKEPVLYFTSLSSFLFSVCLNRDKSTPTRLPTYTVMVLSPIWPKKKSVA